MYNWVVTRKIPRTEGPTYPARAAQTVDAVVRTWIPATAGLLACFVTPARADFDARYYESPNYPVRAVQTVDTTVRTWAPVFDAELASFTTSARSSVDVRRDGWDVGESAWIQATQTVAPTVAQTLPAWTDEGHGFRTPAAPVLDVRRTEWAPTFVALAAVVDQTVATWAPIVSTELASTRTPARLPLDVRTYEWAPEAAPWIVGPVSSAIAPLSAVWTTQAQAFRTPSGPIVDLFRAQSIPDIFGVPDDWITWSPIQDHGGLTPDRARLDVRAYEWSQPAWITVNLPVLSTVAQQWPAVSEGAGQNFRTADRARLDVRAYEWRSDGPLGTLIDATVRTWAPVFATELASTRTADRPRLDVRSTDIFPVPSIVAWSAPPPAVIQAILGDLTTLWCEVQPVIHAADAVGGASSDDTTLMRHDIDAHGTTFDHEDDLNTSLQKYFDTDF